MEGDVNDTNVIERAVELAPECATLDELKKKLVREGYFQVSAHLSGRQIRTQISSLLNRDPGPACN